MIRVPELRALLLDMDGVLVDSTPAVVRVWSSWARERGLDPEDVVRRAHGRPSLSTIRELLPGADHRSEDRELERRELRDLGGVVPLPGAAELLRALPPGRHAVVTSATRALAEARLSAAGIALPAHMVTAGDVALGKPDPEPYLRGAALLGAGPAECAVVEDAPSGVRAGKAAGARVLALLTTAGAGELRAAGADWIVPDLGAVSCRLDAAAERLLLNIEC